MPTIKQECDDCRGTGLYQGFCEAKGEAVICHRCNGQGWVSHSFNTFTFRKRLKGVKTIRESRGTFIATGVGGTGDPMTYIEFEKKYPQRW